MCKTDRYAVYIVRNGTEYLVGVPYTDTLVLRWSTSPYDSCPIHRLRIAKRIAERVGGEVVRFNPITGRFS